MSLRTSITWLTYSADYIIIMLLVKCETEERIIVCICIHLSRHNICTTSQESSTLNKVKLEDNHFHSELFQFLFVFHCSAQCSLQIARHVNGHLMDCLHT